MSNPFNNLIRQGNSAYNLLMHIGGTAKLVAGHNDCYWKDQQTYKKPQRKG